MKIRGKITICRFTGSDEGFHVEFTDDDACVRFATAELTLEQFARCIGGQGWVDCQIEVNGLDLVGTLGESKQEIVPTEFAYGDKTKERKALEAMRKFEVDGWRGDISDLANMHNRSDRGIKVRFFRHVPKVAIAVEGPNRQQERTVQSKEQTP